MAVFEYVTADRNGMEHTGTMSANKRHQVIEELRSQGLFIISVEQKTEGFNIDAILAFFDRVSLLDKIMFLQQLSSMLQAGLPVADSLGILSEQSGNPKFQQVLLEVQKDVESGQQLSASLKKFPKIFNELFVSMVRVGEVGGGLDKALKYLADTYEKDYELRSKIRGALTYPVIILFAVIAIGILMFVVVIPRITVVFEDVGVELPLITRMLIFGSKVLINYGIYITIGLVICTIIFIRLYQIRAVKAAISSFVLKVPWFGDFSRNTRLARFARTLSNLLRSGVPIVESLKVVSETIGNEAYRQYIKMISKKVKKGMNIVNALSGNKRLFPPLASRMISVGEKTGELDVVLERLAQFYETRVDSTTKNLSTIIEPILMLGVGIAVGVFALAIISPIYSILGNV